MKNIDSKYEGEWDRIRLPMVCICSANGKANAEKARSLAIERLGFGTENLIPYNPEDSELASLITQIVASLHWDFRAEITGIYADMWFGMTAKQWKAEEGKLPKCFYVECDDVEDGFVAIYNAIYDSSPMDVPMEIT